MESDKGNLLLVALEQTNKSINILSYKPKEAIYLILGNEVDGVSKLMLDNAHSHIEIPMLGKKESFNVEVAAAISLFTLMNF